MTKVIIHRGNKVSLTGTIIYEGTCMEPALVQLDRGDILYIPVEMLEVVPSE